jgi:hypothetical protein
VLGLLCRVFLLLCLLQRNVFSIYNRFRSNVGYRFHGLYGVGSWRLLRLRGQGAH